MSYLRELREDVQGLKDTVETVLSSKHGGNNVNTVRIEGAGSIWNGLMLGVVFGATIMAGAWIISSQQDMRESIRQAESYRSAVYMLAPRFSEEIDKELDQRKTRNVQHSDSDPASEEAAPVH